MLTTLRRARARATSLVMASAALATFSAGAMPPTMAAMTEPARTIGLVATAPGRTAPGPATPGSLAPAEAPNVLRPGEALCFGCVMAVPGGGAALSVAWDGALVEYVAGRPVWSTAPTHHPSFLVMEPDGNLVELARYGVRTAAVWQTGTGSPGSRFAVQHDGNLVVRSRGGRVLWASGSGVCTLADTCGPGGFAAAVLEGIGAPVTAPNVWAFTQWERAEGGGAGCPGQPPHAAPWGESGGPAGNPLNTTQGEPGSSDFFGFSAFADVDGETCWEWGVAATVATLENGDYGAIISVLRTPQAEPVAQCLALGTAVDSSPWGTEDLVADC